ncbi:MAG: DUF2142 domain-containing protein [Limisphaerales bacterium]
MNIADSNPSAPVSESRERSIVWLLCLLAAVHVFIFSAAFPFFNNVDEQLHFDLVVKYSQGHLPRSLDPISAEAVPYAVLCGSPEFVGIPTNAPDGQFPPPPWRQPMDDVRQTLAAKTEAWHNVINHEASQPPLYYSLAGAWWRLGKRLGFHDGPLLYWLRFLNIFPVSVLVWLGYVAARLVFPEQAFLRLGVPALLAFLPQTAFYSIQNDVLSPLCFGAAFICLVKLLRTEVPGIHLGMLTGLTLAATLLTKISNLPLLAVSGLVLLFKIRVLAKTGKLREAGPALAALAMSVGLPMMAWLAWCKHTFGDFSGTAAKIRFLGWTQKPFSEWWHHPIFTPHGLWTFVSGLLATLWQGEFLWHRQPLAWPVVDTVYAAASVGFVGVAVAALVAHSATAPQRQALWLGFGSVAAAVVFLGFLSILYDFHDCFYPSSEHPYFTSGRLMLGALVPFLLLFVFGLDRALWCCGKPAKFFVLAGVILFMLASEIAIDWRIFPNPYNWFHM